MKTRFLPPLCPRLVQALGLFALLAAGPADASTSALKCRAVRGTIDKTICGSPEYLAMDREIAALVDLADLRFSPDDRHRLADGQTRYLERRASCQWAAHHSAHPGAAVDECLHASMDGRAKALRAAVDRGGFSER